MLLSAFSYVKEEKLKQRSIRDIFVTARDQSTSQHVYERAREQKRIARALLLFQAVISSKNSLCHQFIGLGNDFS